MSNQYLNQCHPWRRIEGGCRGYTLIELMIALGLGVAISAGLIRIMSNTKQNFKVQTASAQILEDGRFLNETMNRELRRARYKVSPWRPTSTDILVFEDEATSTAPASLVNPANAPVPIGPFLPGEYIKGASDNGGLLDGTADSIMVRYQISSQADLKNTLCVGGKDLTYDPAGLDTDNVLYVGLFVDNNGVLQCNAKLKQAGGVYQILAKTVPLIRNVENFRILYGLAIPGGTSATQYVDAVQVTKGGNWRNVVSVKISLVLRSADANIALAPVSDYSVNGKSIATVNPSERRLYQVFSTTITLRNEVL
ncbi:MAG: PilW family protein [Methylococcaceae bacterium]|nr:PilW family protein [Methylococcaceae bacterium]